MICPKGSECRESVHEVRTLDKAREWFPGVTEDQLPLLVNQHKSSDGRLYISVYSKDRRLIYKRG